MRLSELPTKYNPKEVEKDKYKTWVKEGYFTAGDINKKPYTIVIPPPNITGKLHIGHVLDTSLQDIIIRRKRMQGYDALYLPGMDHASIATQTKIEEKLRQQGISRYDLGRDKFMEIAWEWKEEYATLIRDQWEMVGLSVDYSRERFTLDEGLNRAVNEVFIQMYNDGLIYRGEKIINWDVQSKTAISNVEVEYVDIEGAFYSIEYPFTSEEGGLVIATTRPETMFGDVALMVHPKDKRYEKYVGKSVFIPTTTRSIPVIADEYVDMDFGTGIVKVTPAHDPNDFEVGLRHNLSQPLCMNEDGTMNHLAGTYEGLDRFKCRKKLVNDLKSMGSLIEIKKVIHSVGHSERTGVIIEPRLSKQWFVAMEKLTLDLLDMQKTKGRINFVPPRFEKIFNNWLNNIQDWCISRQLWWGHRIPAYYKDDEVYVGINPPKEEGWEQDNDALDTWFSSALWPFSTLGWPLETADLKRYFPTDVLVTGYDIIFFWVARMAFQSKYIMGVRPFKDVLIHGIIRDELGRKLSKSLGNGVDIIDVKEKYGMDSLRYFLTTTASPGQDIRYSDEKMEASWNYINKIWNISRYIGLSFANNAYQNEEIQINHLNIVDKWILTKLNELINSVDINYDKYEFGEVARSIYKFVWNDFASWYLEMTKVTLQAGKPEEKLNTCAVLDYVLRDILKLLHPFMPFVTEEIFQLFNEGSITISEWPKEKKEFNFKDTRDIEIIYDIITNVRNVRAQKNVSNSKMINLEIQTNSDRIKDFINDNLHYLHRFTNYSEVIVATKELDTTAKVVNVLNDVVVAIPLMQLVDVQEELKKLNEQKTKLDAEIERCENMLKNPAFVNKAPAQKVDLERRKLEDYKKQLDEVKKLIEDYN